ncbi:bifunctional phosphoserine phosphatase/homoserine phosphotransferase ThrH [Serratia fonticola]|uniref:bifunctional phosphoserine phosphatase/homoserine phosphotransferase ThrH n=1 Tax=Serratia fonticola TaxID=47917 RepID=UPI003AB02189
MKFACIDMEGVLIPEIWPFLAQKTGLPTLSRTTREEPDYNKLVINRIETLNNNNLKSSDIVREISKLTILPGALEFITQLRKSHRVILVSDVFQQMAMPFLSAPRDPELRCHYFKCDVNGFISSAEYSRQHGKIDVINEIRESRPNSKILAVGDAYNDIEMINNADKGFLFRPSTETVESAGNIKIVQSYTEILESINN